MTETNFDPYDLNKHLDKVVVTTTPFVTSSDESALLGTIVPDELTTKSDEQTSALDFDIDDSISELKTYVGDDKDRAQSVLDAENAKEKPRTTLVTALTEVIEG